MRLTRSTARYSCINGDDIAGSGVSQGPASVGDSASIKIAQNNRAIRIATPSAEGHLEAPWTLTGSARRAGDRIEYELQFVFTAGGSSKSLACSGFWEKAAALQLDDHMSLDGWTVHWLTPMTSTSEGGTILDYGAKPVSELWADLAALFASTRPGTDVLVEQIAAAS